MQTPAVAGGEEGDYLLRVRGESMKDAGILEGDLVVVRPQETAQDGEIVVALVGEEATVKRFFQEADHVRLQPENDCDGADPQPGRARARQGRRADAEHHVTSGTLTEAPSRSSISTRPAKPARWTSSSAAVGGARRPPHGGVSDLRRGDGPPITGITRARSAGRCSRCGATLR